MRRGLAAWLLLAAASCGPRLDPSRPPPVHFGEDPCATCSMIVTDPRFAACAWEGSGGTLRPLAFDDIGCLLDRLARDPRIPEERVWVHAYESDQWLAAREARFVRSNDLETPMASGLAAFADEAAARAFASRRNGEMLDWSRLRGGG